MTTSFQKKTKGKVLQIPGTKPSVHNNQLLVSTGVPSLDSVIGGGIAVGTVLLIEEDTYGSYSKLLLKYFLAEGVMCQHGLFLASASTQPEQIIKELPGAIQDDPAQEEQVPPSGDQGDLKIAWRYQHQPRVPTNMSVNKFGHYFDLTKTMDANIICNTKQSLNFISPEEREKSGHMNSQCYNKLLKKIESMIRDGGYSTSEPAAQARNILRLGIHSLGSPLWGEEGGTTSKGLGMDVSLTRFLYSLRCIMRGAFAVCLITVPTHLFHEVALVRRIEHLCDTVIHLESFVGSEKEKNTAFSEYHGLFTIRKLNRLNSLTCHIPDTLDLAFKLKRKKFLIQRLHLPPELSDTASRNQEDPTLPILQISNTGCSTGTGSKKLDF